MSEIKEDLNEDKPKQKKKILFNSLFQRLKKIKHLDKIITVLFIAIILLIYFSSSFSSGTSSSNSKTDNDSSSENTDIILVYEKELEEKIQKTLASIKDSGEVRVMVCFSEGIETVIAYKTEKQTNNNGVVIETKTPILVTNAGKSETIVLEKIMPKPTSIVVVATGAKNTNVKLEILRAVQTMFGSTNCKIEIFAGN